MEKFYLEDLMKDITNQYHDLKAIHPLILAYIGDAVYEVYVRTLIISKSKASVHQLHVTSIKYVKAKAQSEIIHNLMDKLTDEEEYIVKRGRNAKSGTVPKNADVTDYKYATGFESLIGYLYLKQDIERLDTLLKVSFEFIEGTL